MNSMNSTRYPKSKKIQHVWYKHYHKVWSLLLTSTADQDMWQSSGVKIKLGHHLVVLANKYFCWYFSIGLRVNGWKSWNTSLPVFSASAAERKVDDRISLCIILAFWHFIKLLLWCQSSYSDQPILTWTWSFSAWSSPREPRGPGKPCGRNSWEWHCKNQPG